MLADAGVAIHALAELEPPSALWCGKLEQFIGQAGADRPGG
jgi:hypothetical protein